MISMTASTTDGLLKIASSKARKPHPDAALAFSNRPFRRNLRVYQHLLRRSSLFEKVSLHARYAAFV
jgi:hypothetical protein